MTEDYQPSSVCIVEIHMQKEEKIQMPGYVLNIEVTNQQIEEEY